MKTYINKIETKNKRFQRLNSIIRLFLILIAIIFFFFEKFGILFFYFLFIWAILLTLSKFLESHTAFMETIKKSKNIDITLQEKIESIFDKKYNIFHWILLLILLLFTLDLSLNILNNLETFFRKEIFFFFVLVLFFWTSSWGKIKEFMKLKLRSSKLEVQLFFYLFFDVPPFLLLYFSNATLYLFLNNIFWDELMEFQLDLYPFILLSATILVLLVIIRFVFSLASEAVKKIIEIKTSDLRKEKENLQNGIKETIQNISHEMSNKEIELNYLKSKVYESRLRVVNTEIKRINQEYKQKPPIIAIMITFLAILYPLATLIIEILKLID